jgi:dihydrofolate reductase
MNISVVVAMARNRVIGSDGELPWHLPADMDFFKQTTLGKPIVMGRKTFQSIGRPLPGRSNIVITQNTAIQAAGCTVVSSIENALSAATPAAEVMIIGGASIYEQLLYRTDRIYLTEVHADPLGDTFFPELSNSVWREAWRENHHTDARHAYAYSFVILERRRTTRW